MKVPDLSRKLLPHSLHCSSQVPKRNLYDVPLGTALTYELHPKWVKNEKLLHYVRDDVKPPPSIKPKKPPKRDGVTIQIFNCQI